MVHREQESDLLQRKSASPAKSYPAVTLEELPRLAMELEGECVRDSLHRCGRPMVS